MTRRDFLYGVGTLVTGIAMSLGSVPGMMFGIVVVVIGTKPPHVWRDIRASFRRR